MTALPQPDHIPHPDPTSHQEVKDTPGSGSKRSRASSASSASCSEMEVENTTEALALAGTMNQTRPVAVTPSQLPNDFVASASAWNKGSTGVRRDHAVTSGFGALFNQGPSTASHAFRRTPSGSSEQRSLSTVMDESLYPLPANYWVPKTHSSNHPTIHSYAGEGVSRLASTNARVDVHIPVSFEI